jgi:hypothetical protein
MQPSGVSDPQIAKARVISRESPNGSAQRQDTHSPVLVRVRSGLVASSTGGALVRLFDPAMGEWIESVQGHLNAVFGSPSPRMDGG